MFEIKRKPTQAVKTVPQIRKKSHSGSDSCTDSRTFTITNIREKYHQWRSGGLQ
jgi:hypothetical protein